MEEGNWYLELAQHHVAVDLDQIAERLDDLHRCSHPDRQCATRCLTDGTVGTRKVVLLHEGGPIRGVVPDRAITTWLVRCSCVVTSSLFSDLADLANGVPGKAPSSGPMMLVNCVV